MFVYQESKHIRSLQQEKNDFFRTIKIRWLKSTEIRITIHTFSQFDYFCSIDNQARAIRQINPKN